MGRKNTPDARKRILEAAVKIFAEKSFEGSRIEEIANEANVPKSLIYYHFKNKDEILQVLIEDFVNRYTELLQEASRESGDEKVSGLQKRMDGYSDFGIQNEDLVRIIMIESLKKSAKRPVIFRIAEALSKAEERNGALKENEADRNERLIVEFFTSILPNCAYLCFRESWPEYFRIDKKDFDNFFLKAYMETHGAYHKNHK